MESELQLMFWMLILHHRKGTFDHLLWQRANAQDISYNSISITFSIYIRTPTWVDKIQCIKLNLERGVLLFQSSFHIFSILWLNVVLGWNQCSTGQHGAGQLEMAHVSRECSNTIHLRCVHSLLQTTDMFKCSLLIWGQDLWSVMSFDIAL